MLLSKIFLRNICSKKFLWKRLLQMLQVLPVLSIRFRFLKIFLHSALSLPMSLFSFFILLFLRPSSTSSILFTLGFYTKILCVYDIQCFIVCSGYPYILLNLTVYQLVRLLVIVAYFYLFMVTFVFFISCRYFALD